MYFCPKCTFHFSPGIYTWRTVEILLVVVQLNQIHGLVITFTGLRYAQQAHVVGVQNNKYKPGERAKLVGVDVTLLRPPVRVQAAVQRRPHQLAPAEVIKLVVAPHVVHLDGAGGELPHHRVQRSLRGAAGLVEAVDHVPELEDEIGPDSRAGPTFQGVSQQLQAAPVVPLRCPGEIESVINVRVLNVSDRAECKQRRRLLWTEVHAGVSLPKSGTPVFTEGATALTRDPASWITVTYRSVFSSIPCFNTHVTPRLYGVLVLHNKTTSGAAIFQNKSHTPMEMHI